MQGNENVKANSIDPPSPCLRKTGNAVDGVCIIVIVAMIPFSALSLLLFFFFEIHWPALVCGGVYWAGAIIHFFFGTTTYHGWEF